MLKSRYIFASEPIMFNYPSYRIQRATLTIEQ